jgi:ABC-type glutathione transport system ATPase component
MNNPLIVNLYGGPGSGKSTVAAELFSLLKRKNINAELVTEYAKDLTWQESFNVLKNQIYVFAKQHHRLWRVKDKVDVIITDAPLLISLVYGAAHGDAFKELVKEEYNLYRNYNVLLGRPKHYESSGRTQTLEEAKLIDTMVSHVVWNNGYAFDLFTQTNNSTAEKIFESIKDEIGSTPVCPTDGQ